MMGQHKLKVPDGNKSPWERSKPTARRGTMLFVARDLVVVPVMKLGTNEPSGDVKYEAARTGRTFRRTTRKALSLRDQHRHNVGTNSPNDWGAEWYLTARERSEIGSERRALRHAEWTRLDKIAKESAGA